MGGWSGERKGRVTDLRGGRPGRPDTFLLCRVGEYTRGSFTGDPFLRGKHFYPGNKNKTNISLVPVPTFRQFVSFHISFPASFKVTGRSTMTVDPPQGETENN